MTRALLIFSLLLLLFACEDEPALPAAPSLEVLSTSPLQVFSFKDSIIIELFYQDGDGDLGFKSGDDLALSVTDSRNGLVEKYYVPPLAPDGEAIAIQGTFKLEIPFTFVLNGAGTKETTYYSIQIVDRAGNLSNTATTASIEVLP